MPKQHVFRGAVPQRREWIYLFEPAPAAVGRAGRQAINLNLRDRAPQWLKRVAMA